MLDTMLKKLLFSLLFGTSLYGVAQPKAEFSASVQDVGVLAWHEPGEARFTVTNRGTEPFKITDVVEDCGCTTVQWTSEEIKPGYATTLVVRYDAELLGHFNKGIAVYTSINNRPTYLNIKGNVVLEKETYEGDFPYAIGDYALSTDNIEFDDVNRGDRPEKTLYIKNNGAKAGRPLLMHLPSYLRGRVVPEVIPAGRTGRIVLTLNSDALSNMGLTTTSIYLGRYEGDRVSANNEVNVTATLLPSVTALGNPSVAAPQADISTNLNLGSFGNKSQLKGILTLKNTGNAPLDIKTLQVYNPGIGVTLGKRTIASGKEAKIKVVLSAASRKLRGTHRILLITNDPRQPKIIINVTSGR